MPLRRALIFALFAFSSLTIPHCLARSTQGRIELANFNGQITGLKTIRVVPYQNDPFAGKFAKIAFDDQFAYVATPDGLFRTSRVITADSPITFLGFANYLILNLYVHQNVLYVLKVGGDPRSNTLEAHSFLKSTDHGQTFVPLDEGLKWCHQDYCEYMHVNQAFFTNNLIFVTSGGGSNFYVSKDEGKTWIVLLGFSEPAVCTDIAVEIIGRKVLLGGECPLDFAFLRVGTLREDMLGWADGGFPREVMGLKELQNRNVQFIRHSPNTSFALTGVEGALLRSSDLGESYQYKLSYPPDGTNKFPYIHELLDAGRYKDLFIAGGFDKGGGLVGYLAYSFDHGDTWTDISHLINTPEYSSLDVTFIREDPSGRVLVGLAKKNEQKIVIAEVVITAPLTLLTHGNQQYAVALDSVTLLAGPFSPFNDFNFSSDARTRISLFATNIAPADENISAITVKAEDTQHNLYQLPVEWVGRAPGYPWMTQIVVRLPDALAHAGDISAQIAVRGSESNKALLSIH